MVCGHVPAQNRTVPIEPLPGAAERAPLDGDFFLPPGMMIQI